MTPYLTTIIGGVSGNRRDGRPAESVGLHHVVGHAPPKPGGADAESMLILMESLTASPKAGGHCRQKDPPGQTLWDRYLRITSATGASTPTPLRRQSPNPQDPKVPSTHRFAFAGILDAYATLQSRQEGTP